MTESAETATTATGSAPDGQGNGSAAGGPAGGGPAGRDVAPDAQAEGSPPAPVTEPGRPDITIRETRVYRGPNYYSYEPAVHMVVDIGRLEQFPTDTLPGFTESLLALLPGLHDHQCSRGRDGGFVERLIEGTWAGHVVEHVALEIQRTAGHEITRGKTRSTGEEGVYNVIFGYLDETVGDARRAARRPAGQLPGAGQRSVGRRLESSISTPSTTTSSAPASGSPSGRPPRPSWTRPSPATSPGSG